MIDTAKVGIIFDIYKQFSKKFAPNTKIIYNYLKIN